MLFREDSSRRLRQPRSYGAFLLAEAGLLDGRRATTHWDRAGELQARYANVRVEEDRIFIADGPVWTSAGMTAGIDLALALIEEDLGLEAARIVARRLCCTIAAPAASRSSPPSSNWNRSRTGFRPYSPMPGAILPLG